MPLLLFKALLLRLQFHGFPSKSVLLLLNALAFLLNEFFLKFQPVLGDIRGTVGQSQVGGRFGELGHQFRLSSLGPTSSSGSSSCSGIVYSGSLSGRSLWWPPLMRPLGMMVVVVLRIIVVVVIGPLVVSSTAA